MKPIELQSGREPDDEEQIQEDYNAKRLPTPTAPTLGRCEMIDETVTDQDCLDCYTRMDHFSIKLRHRYLRRMRCVEQHIAVTDATGQVDPPTCYYMGGCPK